VVAAPPLTAALAHGQPAPEPAFHILLDRPLPTGRLDGTGAAHRAGLLTRRPVLVGVRDGVVLEEEQLVREAELAAAGLAPVGLFGHSTRPRMSVSRSSADWASSRMASLIASTSDVTSASTSAAMASSHTWQSTSWHFSP